MTVTVSMTDQRCGAPDVGVAMGRRGTEVACQAADVVLADDELATLVTAVGEGAASTPTSAASCCSVCRAARREIIVMLAGPFLGMPLPLLPAQILWINLMTHGLVGVALGAEPADEMIMRRPPRPSAGRPGSRVVEAHPPHRRVACRCHAGGCRLGLDHRCAVADDGFLDPRSQPAWGGARAAGSPPDSGQSLPSCRYSLRGRTTALRRLPASARSAVGHQATATRRIGGRLLLSLLGYIGIRLDRVLHPR